MKPLPTRARWFVVRREVDEHDHTTSRFYDGLHTVTVNGSVQIGFAPLRRDETSAWPPEPSDDPDSIATTADALREFVAMSDYVVTPDGTRAGSVECFVLDDRPLVVFHVEEAALELYCIELARLADLFGGISDVRRLDQLPSSSVLSFIVNTVLVSSSLRARHQALLLPAGDQ